MMGGIGMQRDVDHLRGGIDEARRSRGPGLTFPAFGEPFPGGIGGARSNGSGLVLTDGSVVDAAAERADQAIRAASPSLPRVTGDLPPGVHRATWSEFAERFGSTPRRQDLLGQLRPALDALHDVGVEQVVVGGSFVGAKPAPGDVDLAFVRSARASVTDAKAALAALAGRAPDVHAYPAAALLTEAPTLAGTVPGWNVLEFFQHARGGAERGVALLDTAPVTSAMARVVGGLSHVR